MSARGDFRDDSSVVCRRRRRDEPSERRPRFLDARPNAAPERMAKAEKRSQRAETEREDLAFVVDFEELLVDLFAQHDRGLFNSFLDRDFEDALSAKEDETRAQKHAAKRASVSLGDLSFNDVNENLPKEPFDFTTHFSPSYLNSAARRLIRFVLRVYRRLRSF